MAPGKLIEMLPVEDIEEYVKAIAAREGRGGREEDTGRTPGTGMQQS